MTTDLTAFLAAFRDLAKYGVRDATATEYSGDLGTGIHLRTTTEGEASALAELIGAPTVVPRTDGKSEWVSTSREVDQKLFVSITGGWREIRRVA